MSIFRVIIIEFIEKNLKFNFVEKTCFVKKKKKKKKNFNENFCHLKKT